MPNTERIFVLVSQIIVFENKSKVVSHPVEYEPSCVSINADKTYLAVGSASDNLVSDIVTLFDASECSFHGNFVFRCTSTT